MAQELTKTYFPALWDMRQHQIGNQPVLIVKCQSPQIYILTQTVKMYKAIIGGENDNSDEAVPTEDKELSNSYSVVIPARYFCIQCYNSFDTLRNFRRHFSDDD